MKTDKLDAEENGDEENANEEFSEAKDIPRFPTMPHISETIALNTKTTDLHEPIELDKKLSTSPKSNGYYIQKV